jgi:hypothetical protein
MGTGWNSNKRTVHVTKTGSTVSRCFMDMWNRADIRMHTSFDEVSSSEL